MPNVSGNQQSGGGSLLNLWNPFDWFNDITSAARDWLGGLAGDIASGVEGGTIAILKDVLGAVLPWLEIIAGAFLAWWAISFYFITSPTGQSLLKLAVQVGATAAK